MTKELFREDAYLKACTAKVIKTTELGIVLDQTIFYPTGGGQPGDAGTLTDTDGVTYNILNTVKDRDSGDIVHLVSDVESLPEVGSDLTCAIDWDRRYLHMRMHTALHIMCAKVDGAVTGGSIGTDKSRLDFDLPDAPDKDALAEAINAEIAANLPVDIGAISDQELEDNPDLVRTMSVKPPMGQGHVRTIRVGSVDYQPCGGTHVKSTGEIGAIRIGKVEKKGKLNRRINIHFA